VVQLLWREYWESFRLSPDFQNFGNEVATLPGPYTPPRGGLLMALVDGQAAGTIAFRPLTEYACEAKRLYVRPAYRGQGIARALLLEVMAQARQAGYREIYGDTLRSMTAALDMYKRFGFCEVAPYSPSPTPDAIFLKLTL
jgi:GNAT superfamily N-acetyltransferase